jgi:hypothetical protein
MIDNTATGQAVPDQAATTADAGAKVPGSASGADMPLGEDGHAAGGHEMGAPGNTAQDDEGYYYDTRTGEVTRGRVRSWSHRMGPYRSREAAAQALEIARARAKAWDEEDQ